ncbi:MAG: hypothetical protein M3083_05815 [Actinomycetota bacterium]|nr:hypothetical protein [Actinomycetota bacterium]
MTAPKPGHGHTVTGQDVDILDVDLPAFEHGPAQARCVTPERPLRYGAIESGALVERVRWDINLIRPD